MSLLRVTEVELRDWMRVLADHSSSPKAIAFAQENILIAHRQQSESINVLRQAVSTLDETKRTRLALVPK